MAELYYETIIWQLYGKLALSSTLAQPFRQPSPTLAAQPAHIELS
jgi:hypothetical protein